MSALQHTLRCPCPSSIRGPLPSSGFSFSGVALRVMTSPSPQACSHSVGLRRLLSTPQPFGADSLTAVPADFSQGPCRCSSASGHWGPCSLSGRVPSGLVLSGQVPSQDGSSQDWSPLRTGPLRTGPLSAQVSSQDWSSQDGSSQDRSPQERSPLRMGPLSRLLPSQDGSSGCDITLSTQWA